MVQTTHKELFTRLIIAPTFDTATATRTIEALDTECGTSSKPELQAHRFRIVVVDTVTALLGPQLSNISSQGNVLRQRPPPPHTPLTSPWLVVLSIPSARRQLTTTMRGVRACRPCGDDDVHAPPPHSGAEARIMYHRRCSLTPFGIA